jgi:predicted metal-dependent hydrolase
MYWYWRLQSIIAQAAARSLFQSGLLEESTSLEPIISRLWSYYFTFLQSIIAQAAARSLFQSGLLEESTSLEPIISRLWSYSTSPLALLLSFPSRTDS